MPPPDPRARSSARAARSAIGLRRWTLRARLQLRRPTARLRALPDFLLVGAQRCGTTSLYRYLSAHPDVQPSLGKELQYFSLHHQRGEGWYRAHFPLDRRPREHGARRLTFEATPYYLFHPLAAERAARLVGDAGIVVLVRDPVDRAFSHYRHSVARGYESLGFEEALDEEPRRLAGEVERMLEDPSYQSLAHRVFSYASRGRYAEQLDRWLAHFPRERVLVLRSEDLYRQTDQTYRRVLRFLDLADHPLGAYPAYTGGRPGAARLPEGVRRRLAERFRASNQRLATLLGQDPGWDG